MGHKPAQHGLKRPSDDVFEVYSYLARCLLQLGPSLAPNWSQLGPKMGSWRRFGDHFWRGYEPASERAQEAKRAERLDTPRGFLYIARGFSDVARLGGFPSIIKQRFPFTCQERFHKPRLTPTHPDPLPHPSQGLGPKPLYGAWVGP